MLAAIFGNYVSQLSTATLDENTITAAKLRVLDLLGAALMGSTLSASQKLRRSVYDQGQALAWGAQSAYSLRDAVVLNGFASHATYLDDGSRYTGGHPSSAVIPSVLTLAMLHDLPGQRLLTSVIAGYEVFLRLGSGIYPSTVSRGFQSTSVVGAAASAAACAVLLGLTSEQTQHAIAMGGCLGGGLKEAMKSPESHPLQVARSCEAGLQAAFFAREGALGALSSLDNGLIPSFGDQPITPRQYPKAGELLIHETYVKRHAGCRGNHAAIDLTEQLIKTHDLSLDDIQSVHIGVDSVTLAHAIEPPKTGLQAQFSVKFAVAVYLLRGDALVGRYNDATLFESDIQSFMQKIELHADAAMDADFPMKRAVKAEVRVKNGQCYAGYLPLPKGEPEFPLSEEEITNKFLHLSESVVGQRAHEIVRLVKDLDKLDGCSALTTVLMN